MASATVNGDYSILINSTNTLDSALVVKGLFAKATILADIYKAFYNIIVNNVSDPGTTSKTKFVYGQYPDNFITGTPSKDLYPFIIVNPPMISWDDWVFKKKMLSGSIIIEVYSSSNKIADTLTDSVIDAIESQRDELWGNKLRNVSIQSTDYEHYIRGRTSVHVRELRFSFRYPFNSTI